MTVSGIVILAKLQSENVCSPMLVTLSGIVMLVKLVQLRNAALPMLVTLPSVGITLLRHPEIKVFVSVSIKQLPAL